jgi:hypothetical protein
MLTKLIGVTNMKNLYLISCAMLLAAPISARSEEIIGSTIYSGAWSGAAYTNDETGKWSHCAIIASYQHNDFDLIFSLTDEYDLGIVLSHQVNPVFAGYEELQIVSKVDNFDPMFATAQVTNDFTAGIWFDDLDTAMIQIAKGNVLTLSSKIGTETFGLKGTYRALNDTYACAKTYENYVAAPKSTPPSNDLTVWNPTGEETAAMYQISTKIISDMKFEDFRFLTGEENFLSGGKGVMWTANNEQLVGGIFVGREHGVLDLQQVMAEEISSLTKMCADGDLALVNSKYIVEDIKTVQVKGVCDGSTQPFSSYMTKQDIGQTLVEVVLFDYGKAPLSGTFNNDMGKNAAIISASYFRE